MCIRDSYYSSFSIHSTLFLHSHRHWHTSLFLTPAIILSSSTMHLQCTCSVIPLKTLISDHDVHPLSITTGLFRTNRTSLCCDFNTIQSSAPWRHRNEIAARMSVGPEAHCLGSRCHLRSLIGAIPSESWKCAHLILHCDGSKRAKYQGVRPRDSIAMFT